MHGPFRANPNKSESAAQTMRQSSWLHTTNEFSRLSKVKWHAGHASVLLHMLLTSTLVQRTVLIIA